MQESSTMSARRSKVRFTQIHVSIPVRLLEDFDEELSFKESRSKAIAKLIKQSLEMEAPRLQYASNEQIFHTLLARETTDKILKFYLKGLLTSEKPDEQSS